MSHSRTNRSYKAARAAKIAARDLSNRGTLFLATRAARNAAEATR